MIDPSTISWDSSPGSASLDPSTIKWDGAPTQSAQGGSNTPSTQTVPVATGAGGQAQLSPDQYHDYLTKVAASQTTPANVTPAPDQGIVRRAVGGMLQPYTGLASGLEKGAATVANATGNNDIGSALQQASENSALFGSQTQPGIVSGVGRMVGALPQMMAGGAGAIAAGANTAATELNTATQNQHPLDLKNLTVALTSGGVDTAMTYLMGKGVSSDIAKDVIRQLPMALGDTGAKVVARSAAGATLGSGGQVLQNLIHGQPWNANLKDAAGQMAAMELGGGALHDVTQEPTAASQPTPAAPPTVSETGTNVPETGTQPAATQAETPAQPPQSGSDYQFGPLHPDATAPTVFTARRAALERAATLDEPQHITSDGNGGFRVTSSKPDTGWTVEPTGKISPISGNEPSVSDRAQTDMEPATPTKAPQRANGEEQTPANAMGAGPASPNDPNFTKPLEGPMALKNEHMEQDRAARGNPAPTPSDIQTDAQTHSEAMDQMRQNPRYVDDLVKEINDKPRSLSDTETAAMRIRQMDLRNQQDDARAAIVKAHEDGDPSTVAEHQMKEGLLSDQLLDLQDAAKKAGTEQGRGLRARQVLLDRDYSLAGMETEKRAVNGGAPLTDDQKSQMTDLQKQIKTSDQQVKEYQAKQPKVFTAEDRLKAYKTRLNARIDSLNEQIASGVQTRGSKNPIVGDTESDSLKSYRDVLQGHYDDMFGKNAPKQMTDEQRLAAYKKRMTSSILDKADRLTDDDYTPKVKRPLILDAEGRRLQAENDRLKKMWDQGLQKDRMAQQSPLRKGLNLYSHYVREAVVSGPATIARVIGSGAQTFLLHPLDQMASSLVRAAVPALGEKTNVESGFNPDAFKSAFAKMFTDGLKDSKDIMSKKRGYMSDIDAQFGKGRPDQSAIAFFGRLHGAVTAPFKRFHFEYALGQQAEAATRLGLDPMDPIVQQRMGMEAAKYATRSAFQEDRTITNMMSRAKSALKEPDAVTGRDSLKNMAGEATMNTLQPVVKVGNNVMAQTFERGFGSIAGAAELGQAYWRGMKNLKPEEADVIVRHLSRGIVGGAILASAFMMPKVPIPSLIKGTPLGGLMQAGQSLREESDKNGVPAGVAAAAWGIASGSPYYETAKTLVHETDRKDKLSALKSIGEDAVVPQLIQQPYHEMYGYPSQTKAKKVQYE